MRRFLSALLITTVFLIVFPITTFADNPVIKDRFSADPAALVHDNKIYLYTGHDEATPNDSFFVLKEWLIFSSDDGSDWTYESALPRTTFDWAIHHSAWASQAVEKDGTFYWYTTVHNSGLSAPGYAIAVASSDSPTTGFTDAINGPLVDSSMTTAPDFMGDVPWDNIDPTVFIDDDGQAYMYWGNTHLYYAKLKDNMIELEGDIERMEIQNMPGNFTEGPFLFKRDALYYLTFAYNYPEELAYAVSTSPSGPWYFQDKIMDKIPNSGTSHPAVIEFDGAWYFIYHTAALPGGGEYRRSVAMEPLHFYDDGAIAKVTSTASGIDTHSLTIAPTDSELMVRQVTNALRLADGNTHHVDYRWHETTVLTGETPTVSYQIDNNPGVYLTINEDNNVQLQRYDGSDTLALASSFIKSETTNGVMLQPASDPHLYLSVSDERLTFLPLTDDPSVTQQFVIEAQSPIIPEQRKPLTLPVENDSTDKNETTVDSTLTTEESTTSDQQTDEAPLTLILTLFGSLIVLVFVFYYRNKKPKA
ncbi:glycoside hydrolase family 43 protein [Halolactibacillus sp. JCM 19043]|uniref:glycoside hydrolase family 43 protein n=1 Tax=Halolactibacillus sp. JCM 19043 TaxID=1460638 RepID=UPI000781EF16|nr:glycoside hydrolase family 43 protein [Halolactibacillus sp. JCM 19043]